VEGLRVMDEPGKGIRTEITLWLIVCPPAQYG
jgi:hypothetical protein